MDVLGGFAPGVPYTKYPSLHPTLGKGLGKNVHYKSLSMREIEDFL
jgi:hypothetical protein